MVFFKFVIFSFLSECMFFFFNFLKCIYTNLIISGTFFVLFFNSKIVGKISLKNSTKLTLGAFIIKYVYSEVVENSS